MEEVLNKKIYNYSAFGLNIESEVYIPELTEEKNYPDVKIKLGKIPNHLDDIKASGVLYEATSDLFLLNIDNVAKYLVIEGKDIFIETFPGSRADEIRLFLLGSVIGALIHQRGLLPLHGSAINFKGHGIIFSGQSGTGKSTLAAAFSKENHKILADDICVINISNSGLPLIYPAFPQLKLWQDVMSKLGNSEIIYKKLRPQIEKFGVEIKDNFYDKPLVVNQIYFIHPRNKEEIEIKEVRGVEKFNEIKNNTYRFRFLEGIGNKPLHFKLCNNLIKHSKIFKVYRSYDKFKIEDLIKEISNNIEKYHNR